MDPARAEALAVALDLPRTSATLPPFFHQIYFWDAQPPEALGRDGHPAVGGFIPDLGLPRRMWAGGRLQFMEPIMAGVPATRQTEIQSVERKSGRSGALAFVTLRHELRQADTLCLIEEQDLVYREEAGPEQVKSGSRPAPADCDAEPLRFTSTLLFRYSALTFNGHRIHYDADYAREVEGYAGLVVHGPLLAQLLMLRAEAVGRLTHFDYRGARALTVGESAALCRDGTSLWVRNGDGELVMEAVAEWS